MGSGYGAGAEQFSPLGEAPTRGLTGKADPEVDVRGSWTPVVSPFLVIYPIFPLWYLSGAGSHWI